MANTKRFLITMAENNHRQIKAMAAQEGVPMGTLLQQMVDFILIRGKHRRKKLERSGNDVEISDLMLAMIGHDYFQQMIEDI